MKFNLIILNNFIAEEYKMMIERREIVRKEFQEKNTEMSHVSQIFFLHRLHSLCLCLVCLFTAQFLKWFIKNLSTHFGHELGINGLVFQFV